MSASTSSPVSRPASPVSSCAPGGAGVVGAQELRDLWLTGRGPLLVLAYSVQVSVVTYRTATTQALNFLEQREAVSLIARSPSASVPC